jgi:ATP-dependent Lhr-like helicase
MLTRPDVSDLFASLRCVVVDEWHELMSTKRGVQTELALARVRAGAPQVRTWGVSATLGNLTESLETLLGPERARHGEIVRGESSKEIVIDSILPDSMDRFPWSGHFGTQMIPKVIEALSEGDTCLVFTNTRAMAEIWHQTILEAKPEWAETVGLHHGSLDRKVRDEVEAGLKTGRLRAVICTSSLDLGVDFSPVDRVLQIGSPKGVARLLQRAGRSGHQPGRASRVTCVPTHAFELIDIAAARDAAIAGRVESREGVKRPLDLLAQHLVTVAIGEPFEAEAMKREVRTSKAFEDLTDEEWKWTLDFLVRGGDALRAYPEYQRLTEVNGKYQPSDDDVSKRHKMTVGTIVSDAAMTVQYVNGVKLGTVEESFLARLNPGDKFIFGGKALVFVRLREMTAWVRRATNMKGAVPRWSGGRLPLSSELSHAIREKLELAKDGILESDEMRLLAPLLQLQAKWSAIPSESEFLIERVETQEGHHLFFFPFEGRLVHEGLAALFATRIARLQPITFTIACNDYGFELLAAEKAPLQEALDSGLLSQDNLAEDIASSLNSVELARRQFREVARIAGLVFGGYPGMAKSAKQIQASSGLFYDVFARYDPNNLLLRQAKREVLERQLEQSRMAMALGRLSKSRILIAEPPRPTPMCFPILVDRLRETLSSEDIGARIQRMVLQVEMD